jgi:PBSX family phage terminase large subunit
MPIQLTPAQATIALDRHRFRVLCCGRRFGKTTLAIDQIKSCAALRPNSRIAYIAPTFQQARDIAWQELKRDCKDAAELINETRLEIKLVNGSLIILRGWEAIETLRGQRFDLVVVDEVASMREFWLNWQEVVRPTLTDTKGEAIFISTPKGFNHFYNLYNLRTIGLDGGKGDPDFQEFHYTTYDNPHIPTSEIEKAQQELGANRFAQEYMADFRKTEGLVYQDFEREKHVYTQFNETVVEKIAGVDFGFTNPCAVIELWRDRSDTFWIENEFYERGRTDSQVAEYVAAQNFNKVYPDPEAPAAIQELRKRGVPVRDVIKGKDSIVNGITKVQDLLRAGKLKVNARCVNTIMEFETYIYPERKPGHNENEVPIDENNHAMDALRYPIQMIMASSNKPAQVFYPSHNPIAPTPTQLSKVSVGARTRYAQTARKSYRLPG